jgi:integrase
MPFCAEELAMPRLRTGSAYRHGDHFDIRITLPGGERSRPMCQPPDMSLARARDKAQRLTLIAAKEALPGVEPKRRTQDGAAPSGETLAAWSERWCAAREERGLTSVDDDRGRLRKWVLPHFEGKAAADITRTDLERLVEKLDASVRAGACSWSTARNVWAIVTKMFDDACNSKVLALRVLTENPCTGVRGPDRGAHKSKAYVFPAEFSALMSCHAVPVTWRSMYAVTTYLYLRAAEARALEWSDVDLDQGIVLVHHTEDDAGRMDSTKSMRARRFKIETALLPLLRAMRARSGGVGRVLPRMPVEKHLAPMLRRHLEAAGITRADLHTSDSTRKRLRFHDLRATGLTWMAVRGDDPLKIKQRAGHRTFSTTEGYIREAEAVRDGFGEVFPVLPEALVSSGESSERVGANGHVYEIKEKTGVGEAGFESSKKRAKLSNSRRFSDAKPATSIQTATPNPAISGEPDDSLTKPSAVSTTVAAQPATPSANPRGALLAHLTAGMTAALAAGDLDAAKVAHDAIGRLLGGNAQPGMKAEGAVVIDLDAERERRAGR